METPAGDILNRATREYLHNLIVWDREERGEPDPRSYDERINAARQKVMESIAASADKPGADAEETAAMIQELLDTAKDVYTAVGMKVGTDLAQQALDHMRRTKERSDNHTDEEEDPEDKTGFAAYCENEDFLVEHSHNSFERMAPRVNLQVLGSHIRDFGQRTRIEKKTYQERTNDALELLEHKVRSLTNEKTASEIEDAVSEFEFTIVDVYFSLGMKAGARLNALLMGDFDKDY